jgi:catechol 2,3-dioxygenase-like lactoylglutathione lyase family enzyme
MSHLELVALVVRDYHAAIRFFVDVLQVELHGTPPRPGACDPVRPPARAPSRQ